MRFTNASTRLDRRLVWQRPIDIFAPVSLNDNYTDTLENFSRRRRNRFALLLSRVRWLRYFSGYQQIYLHRELNRTFFPGYLLKYSELEELAPTTKSAILSCAKHYASIRCLPNWKSSA